MVRALGRHVFRPAHLHFMIKVCWTVGVMVGNTSALKWPSFRLRGQAPGFETLITALYFPGDPYLTSDAVFGVKQSLVVVS
jgi:protocatechuate 3,4-dioxygenase beta subunit